MKKLIAAAICFAMLCAMFVGCAKKEADNGSKAEKDTTATTEKAPETDAPETGAPETDAPETEPPATTAPAEVPDPQYSIELPEDMEEIDDEDYLYFWANDESAVMVLAELKSDLEGYAETEEEYAELIISIYSLESEIEINDAGHPEFVYTSEVDGTTFVYCVVIHADADYFYMSQFACPLELMGSLVDSFNQWSATIVVGDAAS